MGQPMLQAAGLLVPNRRQLETSEDRRPKPPVLTEQTQPLSNAYEVS
jgi:hypothetical protein